MNKLYGCIFNLWKYSMILKNGTHFKFSIYCSIVEPEGYNYKYIQRDILEIKIINTE